MNTLPPIKSLKTLLNVLALAFLLCAAPSQCFAEMGVEHISKELAKELGIEIRLKGKGPNEVWVELELNTEGALKDFIHVSLEISEGEKFLMGWAPLQATRGSAGMVVVGFLVNRAFLDKVTLRVVTGRPMDETGHDLRVRDFVYLEKDR